MKEILLMLFITTAITANAAPSGYVSLNIQETKLSVNKKVVYVSPKQHYYWMYTGAVNPNITMFNGMVNAKGVRIPYSTSAIQKMSQQNAEASLDSLQQKLNVINRNEDGAIYKVNGVIAEINLRAVDSTGTPIWAAWLVAHTYNGYVEFNLNPGDSVYLLGRYGDTAQNKYGYVGRGAEANGWFGILHLENGHEFLLYRVACQNSIRGWRWLLNGKAEVVKEEDEQAFGDDGVETDPKPAKPGKGRSRTFVNGKEVNAGNGDTYITINNNNNNVATGGKGGSSNNDNTNTVSGGTGLVGKPNPNYRGPGLQPAPIPSPVPYVQPVVQPQFQPWQQQPFFGQQQFQPWQQQPFFGQQAWGFPNRQVNVSLSLGGGQPRWSGNNQGCYGGYNTGTNWPTRNPQPVVPTPMRGPDMGPGVAAGVNQPTPPTPMRGPDMGYPNP